MASELEVFRICEADGNFFDISDPVHVTRGTFTIGRAFVKNGSYQSESVPALRKLRAGLSSRSNIKSNVMYNRGKSFMQISTKFTIAIHILAAVEYFGKEEKVTSDFLASSIGSNPVIIRNLMSDLKNAGLIEIKRGPGGIRIARPLDEITFYDVYEAVEKNKDDLFHFHENTNPKCPVGRNIHSALYGKLQDVQKDFEESLKKHKLSDVIADLYKEIAKAS